MVVGFTITYAINILPQPMLWVRIPQRATCATICDKDYQWLATGRWFFYGRPGTLISSTNKTDCRDIAAILLKVALSTTEPTKNMQAPSLFQLQSTYYSPMYPIPEGNIRVDTKTVWDLPQHLFLQNSMKVFKFVQNIMIFLKQDVTEKIIFSIDDK